MHHSPGTHTPNVYDHRESMKARVATKHFGVESLWQKYYYHHDDCQVTLINKDLVYHCHLTFAPSESRNQIPCFVWSLMLTQVSGNISLILFVSSTVPEFYSGFIIFGLASGSDNIFEWSTA